MLLRLAANRSTFCIVSNLSRSNLLFVFFTWPWTCTVSKWVNLFLWHKNLVSMCHDYLTPKHKCFQLSLILSVAEVLLYSVVQTWSSDAEVSVAEAGICLQYNARPVRCWSKRRPLLATRLMSSVRYHVSHVTGCMADSDWWTKHTTQ